MPLTILGNSGSGKSTLAARLAAATDIPVLDLDTIVWEPGKIAVPRDPEDVAADLHAFCSAHDDWIVEGCYAGLAEQTLRYDPILLFLDPGEEACLANCRERPWEPHKYASKEAQDANLPMLLQWVSDYYSRQGDMSWAAHEALLRAYEGEKMWVKEQVSQFEA